MDKELIDKIQLIAERQHEQLENLRKELDELERRVDELFVLAGGKKG